MDQHDNEANGIYMQSLQAQIDKTHDASNLPSAQLMHAWQQSQLDFKDYMLEQAKEHRDVWIKQSLADQKKNAFEKMVTQSLLAQQQLEDSQAGTLDDYLQQQ
jgi:gamma-glutamylcysteine synthetase